MSDNIPQETPETEVIEYPRDNESIKKRRVSQLDKQAKIVDMSMKNIPIKDIAKVVDMKPAGIRSVMTRFNGIFKDLDKVSDYRQHKADIIDACQLIALKTAFSEAKLKKAGFSALIAGVKELNNISRLENNQSTTNLAVSFGNIGLQDDK